MYLHGCFYLHWALPSLTTYFLWVRKHAGYFAADKKRPFISLLHISKSVCSHFRWLLFSYAGGKGANCSKMLKKIPSSTLQTWLQVYWPSLQLLTFVILQTSLSWWLFPCLRKFGGKVWQFIPYLHFLFFSRRSVCTHQFHFLGQDQSTVAQRAETTVAEYSLTSCMWARLRIGSYAMPGQHSQPTPTMLGQGACVFRCNLPLALLAEWTRVFHVPMQ